MTGFWVLKERINQASKCMLALRFAGSSTLRSQFIWERAGFRELSHINQSYGRLINKVGCHFIHYLQELELWAEIPACWSAHTLPGRKIYLRNHIKVRRLNVKYGSWTNQVGCFEGLFSLSNGSLLQPFFHYRDIQSQMGEWSTYSAGQRRLALEKC